MKKTIRNAIYIGLVAVVGGLGGCSKRFNDHESIARVYNGSEMGTLKLESDLYQGYDENNDGTIDHIAKDTFAQPSGRIIVHLGRRNLTVNDGVAFDDVRKILEAKLSKDAKRKELAEEIYGNNGLADSDSDEVLSYNEFIDMYQKAGLEYQIVALSQYRPRKTEELRQASASFGNI